jgi:hypothetical protein
MDYHKLIDQRVHEYYWTNDYNCARTTMKSLAELLSYTIDDQLDHAAMGMHGAGGYQAQCGIVEGTLLLLGCYLKSKHVDDIQIVKYCYDFAESFETNFGSLICKMLRPIGFSKNNPPHACEELTKNGIKHSFSYFRSIAGNSSLSDVML